MGRRKDDKAKMKGEETRVSGDFDFPSRGKRRNWVILLFAYKRNAVFPVFYSSLTSETLFFAFFAFRLRATGSFHRFLLFAYKRNVVFRVFCISLASDEQFFPFSGFSDRAGILSQSRGKQVFKAKRPSPRNGAAASFNQCVLPGSLAFMLRSLLCYGADGVSVRPSITTTRSTHYYSVATQNCRVHKLKV